MARCLALVCLTALCCGGAAANTHTWNGNGGSLLFNLGTNWTGGIPLSLASTNLAFAGTNNTGTLGSPVSQNIGLGGFALNSIAFNSGASSFFLGGGAFAFSGTAASSNTITQHGSSAHSVANAITTSGTKAPTITLTGDGTGVITLSGQITPGSRDFAIVKTGSSTYSLAGANTYGGATSVNAGVLNIQHAQALGSTSGATAVASGAALQMQGGIAVGAEALTLNGSGVNNTGALRNISGNNSFGGAIALGSATTIGSDSGNLTLGGAISGNFSLTKVGAGTVTVTGANTFTGTVTIQNGTLSLSTDAFGNTANTVVMGGSGTAGALQYTGSIGGTTMRSFSMAAGGTGIFDITASAAALTVGNVINGGGALTKTGAGTLVLSAVNTYTGGTTVAAGTLRLSADQRLASSGALTISGGTLDLQTFGQSVGVLTMTGGSVTGTGTLTALSYNLQGGSITAAMGGSASVIKNTSGTLTLNSANTYTGSTAVNAGVLQVNMNNALGTAANGTTVAAGAALRLNAVNYSTLETLTLNGSGIANGGALVNSGTSTYAGAISAATHATINAGGGVLNLTGGVAKNGTTLTIAGGGTVNINNKGITGSSPNSDLVVDGTTVVLNAASTYNGPTTIQNSGTLQLGANNVLPSSPQTALTINTSSALNLAGYSDGVASLSGDTTGTVRNSAATTTSTLTVNPATGVSTTFAGTISGTNGGAQGNVALVKSGAGSLTLTGANTYSGSTTVNGGTLTVANTSGSAAAQTASIIVNSGGTLLLGASDQINDTAPVALGGGTIGKGNFSEGKFSDGRGTAGFGALTLTATGSTLDFGTGTAGTLLFANFAPNTFKLAIDNWSGTVNSIGSSTTDRLIFASDQTANLSSFSFTGYSGATQFALADGYYEIAPMTPVPEPSTYAAAALALLGVGFQQRARLKRLLHRLSPAR